MQFDITKHNVGNIDSLIRMIFAAVLIVSIFRGSSWTLLIVAAALAATAYYRFCPTYAMLGFSTEKDDSPDKDASLNKDAR